MVWGVTSFLTEEHKKHKIKVRRDFLMAKHLFTFLPLHLFTLPPFYFFTLPPFHPFTFERVIKRKAGK